MSEQLKPCPFCGSEAVMLGFSVTCINCDASSKPTTKASTAIAAWNARIIDRRVDELQSQIDMLMLEYCPEEMTVEQRARWAESQTEEN